MASSDLFEANQASSSQPSLTEDNIGMEPKYYKAAAKGEIEVFKDIKEPLNQLLTPNRNTILHIRLTSIIKESDSLTVFVKEILKKCPSLLRQANVKGETPLHIAARYGHARIVKVLIKRAKRLPQEDLESGVSQTVKEMLEMTNNEKDTAFHEAVRGNHFDVVKLLIQQGPDISYSQNDAGETPLYIAVERNYEKVAFHILETCTSPAHDGPLGRTTLHAAVIRDNGEMIQKILKVKSPDGPSDFSKQVDHKQRWTPLHYAAYFDSYSIVEVLLKFDRSIAYMKDAESMTALHIAAHQGHDKVMKSILEGCPDCCELVDKRGWNALHFAVNSSSGWYGVKDILKKSSFSNLLNEKDFEGNTPLHHHSNSLHYIKDVMCHDRVDKMAFNKENFSAYDIALSSEKLSDKKFMGIRHAYKRRSAEFRRPREVDIKTNRKSGNEWKARKDQFVFSMKKESQIYLVVDTLIATVAFTAGITMPGGFISHEGPHPGSAVLTRNAAFKAFIITNTIAMVQSCIAAFIQLFMPLLFHDKNPGDFPFLLASLAFCLSISAMGAMVLAFVSGTYAVLMQSLGLAIANSVIGLFFFIPVIFVTIGCLDYLLEILRVATSWILDRLCDFMDFLGHTLVFLGHPLVCILRILINYPCILCIIFALSAAATFFLVVNLTGWWGQPL